ncbi:4'-phosphopantetheinyl transferase superfamily protein [Mesorhizobium sp. M0618]|uniref:4'-phosphopantetheinyl transferase family protein n=1 Tax=unclassified Mesorhizobium TaxID=325217 RepID=UPI003337F785
MSMEPARIAAWIEARAPQQTAVAVDRIMPGRAFDTAEELPVARAVASRRDEFATGRRLAREALGRLGCAPASIPPDADRVPVWPEGFLGTISHAGGLCVAHVGRTCNLVGLGIDIESTSRLEPALATAICRIDEHTLDGTNEAINPFLLRFVAKEAFFKAYFPAARSFLEFHDVRVEIDSRRGLFEARLMHSDKPALEGARAFVGCFESFGTHVAAAVWIER